MVTLPFPDVRALASGEVITAFVPRGALTEGDEIELSADGPRNPHELKPAYRRWASDPVAGEWSAVVVSVHPAVSLDPETGDARHILSDRPDGDLALLRVYDGDRPVLSDQAFDGRRRSVEGSIIP